MSESYEEMQRRHKRERDRLYRRGTIELFLVAALAFVVAAAVIIGLGALA